MVRVLKSTIIPASCDQVWAILREFNGFDRWHPEFKSSQIERNEDDDRVGCTRKFRLTDGSELRERLLALSDAEQSFSYCLLETPLPLFNYVAHARLVPVTDRDQTYWEWEGRFTTEPGREEDMVNLVGEQIFMAGFRAIRTKLGGGKQ